MELHNIRKVIEKAGSDGLTNSNCGLTDCSMDMNQNREPDTEDDSLRHPLFKALSQGDEKSAQLLVKNGTDLNVKDGNGNTPLMYSIQKGMATLTDLFVQKGCDVNLQNSEGETPLHLAVELHQTALVKLLVEKSTDVNIRDSSGQTPLTLAIKNGSKEMLCLLLKNGADKDTTNEFYDSPLMDAISNNQLSLAEILIKKGCDCNFQNQQTNETALHLAIELSSVENDDLSIKEQTAFSKNFLNVAKLLIKNGCIVNQQNKDGDTPLHLVLKSVSNEGSLKKSYRNLAEMLVQNQCNVNVQNNEKDTPLHLMAKSGHSDLALMKILFKKGADVNVQDANGSTVFLCLLNRHYDNFVKYILKSNVTLDLNTFNISGSNALNTAVDNRQIDIVKRLIDRGVDVNAKNYKNQIALLFAVSHSGLVQLLLDHGSEVDVVDSKKRTPLYLACNKCNLKACKMLLSTGADPNLGGLQSRKLYTSLVKTRGSALSDVCKLLIKYGWRCDLYPHHDKYPGLLCTILTDSSVELNNENQTLVNLAFIAGSSSQQKLWSLLTDPDKIQHWESYPERKKWLIEKCSEPMSLKNLARIIILRQLWTKPNRMTNIQNLDIPQCLELFLQFQHINSS